MIEVTLTHRQGVELNEELTIGIDPEKIVSVRDRGSYAEIEYAETYDRRRQPITYQLTTSRAAIDAVITGTYDTLTEPYLELTVYDTATGDTYSLDLQEKYIVDIREVYTLIDNTVTACRRIEYVPGSFKPEIIYVSNSFASMIDSTPAEVTTTTTVGGE
jgi:hypothetical protein